MSLHFYLSNTDQYAGGLLDSQYELNHGATVSVVWKVEWMCSTRSGAFWTHDRAPNRSCSLGDGRYGSWEDAGQV